MIWAWFFYSIRLEVSVHVVLAIAFVGLLFIVGTVWRFRDTPPRPLSSRTKRERWKAGLADDEFPDQE